MKYNLCLMWCLIFGIKAIAQESIRIAHPIVGEVPQKVTDEYRPVVEGVKTSVWVENLTIPWSLKFLPNGDALVSQRPGSIVRIPSGTNSKETYLELPEVTHEVDAGLMGMDLHPEFGKNGWIYVMYAYRNVSSELTCKVVRLIHKGNTAVVDKVVLDDIPAYAIHLGGRIAFGPDGMLYIGTGDLANPYIAQDLTSLASKILRITPEGSIPSDNPFPNSPVFSYGHRVVQGFAWDPETGAFFNSEHGPSGAEVEGSVRYRDEINLVKKGGNHGWPLVVGAPKIPDYQDPIACWNLAAVPPGGMVFHDGDLFVASLGGQSILRLVLDRNNNFEVKKIERWFSYAPSRGIYGRFRDITVGPDGHLYAITSNTDGRAPLQLNDDRIIKIEITK
ncbi:PQQ-dependent sugar dehydrogenase [Lunatimonas lonarensis]|nr:PQQ-dependent sugar dehydrogenase [Lunatimonas lonarensis]